MNRRSCERMNPSEGQGIQQFFRPMAPMNSRQGLQQQRHHISAYSRNRAIVNSPMRGDPQQGRPSDPRMRQRNQHRNLTPGQEPGPGHQQRQQAQARHRVNSRAANGGGGGGPTQQQQNVNGLGTKSSLESVGCGPNSPVEQRSINLLTTANSHSDHRSVDEGTNNSRECGRTAAKRRNGGDEPNTDVMEKQSHLGEELEAHWAQLNSRREAIERAQRDFVRGLKEMDLLKG